MLTQSQPLVARKPFEHFFFPRGKPLITHLYGVYLFVDVCVCVCVWRGPVCVCVCVSLERVLAKLSTGAAPVSSLVIIMSPSPCLTEHTGSAVLWPLRLPLCVSLMMICVLWVHVCVCTYMWTWPVSCYNLNSCWCWQPVLSIVVQWAIAEADRSQVGPPWCWTQISPPCDSLFKNAPAHLSPLAAPVKSWFAHRHRQRNINSTPCRLARGERRHTQTNQTIWKEGGA